MNNTINIYNSLTRKKEEFIPINSPQVNIYTCGVTVYDESHIGHARSLYIFDVIRRYLKYRGFKVNFVRNITDIDDKIINRANELKVDWKDLVKKYIDRYYEDLQSLGIEKGDFEPRATENIPEMIKYIQGLIDKGFAYVTNRGVYFSVRKFKNYGKLSGQSTEQMLTGVRKEPDETKEDPLDFALWKISKPGEPSWDSPCGKGRPGWHIECSVMSQEFLKTDTLDIHAGGRDLIFPHHENEIAQAEALTGKPFAKYWIHHGLLTINGRKMAKSLGNFVTIRDFLDKYHDADILKIFFLSAHYSQPIDYNDNKIEESKRALDRINEFLFKAHEFNKEVHKTSESDFEEINKIKIKFEESMDDDFNTPRAIASIFDLVSLGNKNIENKDFFASAINMLGKLSSVLGMSLTKFTFTTDEGEIQSLILERKEARKKGDFSRADKIREDLEKKGVILQDTKNGKTIWRRKS
jgi:cysteinyl-tRNA synthetase